MSLVTVIQFYQGDRTQALALSKFIADITPSPRADVEIVFAARFDAFHDSATIDYVASKFPVSTLTTTRKWTGWPAGPNGMALDVLEWAAKNRAESDGVLLLEPDCVPLAKDWINQIIRAWADARAAASWLMGSFRQSGPPCGHVNGNAVILANFANLVDLRGCPQDYAWDCWIANAALPHAKISGLFLNKFRSTGATEDVLRTPEVGDKPPCLVHGYRDTSALDIARKWLL